MNCQRRFCAPALAAMVMVTLFASSEWMNGQATTASGQTAAPSGQTAPVPSISTRMPSASFLSAPAFKLSDIPSGVVATDLDGDGKPDLVVAFASTGKVVVYLGAGKGKFQTPVEYSVGGHPVALAAVDINGDGQLDIVTANGADGTVSVLLGGTGGKLGTTHVSTVGVDANYLATSDLNGDGAQDVVVASRKGQALAVLLNDGHGALQAAAVQSLGKTPTGLVTGDFNGDRHVDAAVASDDGTVAVLLGGGDGTLQMGGSFVVSGAKIWSLATADFNRDGSPDLAVTQADGRLLTAFLGKGDGTFGTGTSYLVGNGPVFTATVDVNGDGFVDLISVNQGSNTVSVLLGNGDGSFQNAKNFTVGDGPVAVATGDFYGTGFAGLAVVDASAKTLNAIAGKGDGTFRAAPSYSGDLSPRAIASGDLNGDGLPDIVVTNFCGSDAKCAKGGSLSVYLGQASGGYKLASTQVVGVGPVSVALADLNGDGNLDVLALNRDDKTLSVLLGVGDGTLQAPTTTSLAGSPVAVVAKDFNQDGKIDLAVVSDCGSAKCTQPGSVDVYFGGGDGSFSLGTSYPVSYSPTSIAAGDLNGDGIVDLVVANACGKDASCNSAGTATVLLGGAKGIFTAQADVALNNAPSSIALRSATGKAALDIVVAHEADNTVAVLKGNGDGTFLTPTVYTVGSSPRSLAIADLNGDGTPDVAVANAKDSTVSVLYGKSDGTLVAGGSYAVAAGPEALTAVAGTAGLPASLVTANGNSTSSTVGTEITSLLNASPNTGTAPSTTAFTSVTPASPTVNTAVTMQVLVSDAVSGLPVPDGETVTFSSDDVGTLTCTSAATTTSGVASCTTSQLTTAVTTLTATYGGDATYAGSSGTQSLTVTAAPATLTLTGPSTTPTVNQSATFTATLSSTAGFTPTAPSGTISITINGQAVSGCTAATASATVMSAMCSYTPTSTATLAVAATYTGDINFTVATQPTLSQTVSPAPATLTLTGPSATPTVNQSATYTATLASTAGFTPTAASGTISFTINGQAVSGCPATTVSSAVLTATCAYTATAAGSLPVAASYSNDANFTVASQPTLSQTISSAPATLTLTGPSTTPTVNQSATYTATLASTAGFTPAAASGTISFTVNGQAVSGCPATTVSSTVLTATCAYTATAPGSLPVAANYSNDANFTVATQPTLSQTVNPAVATLTLTGPSTTPTVNQSATFTATLASTAGFTPTAASGTISFTINGQAVSGCPATTVSSAVLTATCTYTALAAGSLPVAATYSNDTNFTVASQPTLSQTVNAAPATLTLTGPSTPPTVNQSVTFTATLASTAGYTPTPPSGMIAFTINGQPVAGCPSTTVSAATLTATCTYTPLAAGSLPVAATYSNDANFTVANQPTLSQTVNPVAATLTLNGPSTTPTVNQAVMFTATLGAGSGSFAPTAPSGTISLAITGQPGATCQTTMVSSTTMTANCTVTALAAGSLSVVATYAGDTNFVVPGGTSSTLTQTINKIPTTLSLSQPSPSTINTNVTFTATLNATPTTPTTPGGMISFTVNGDATVCPAVTLSGGSMTATCVTSKLVYPSDVVVATYSGDGNYTGPSTATVTQIVNKIAAQTAVSPSTTSAVVNQPVTFTATLQGTTSGLVIPSGNVTFRQGSTVLCSGPVVLAPASSTTSTATCQVAFAAVSAAGYTVTATYSGDSNFTPGTAGTATAVTVGTATTTVTLASAPSPSAVDQIATFTATIGVQYSGTAVPTGTVNFVDQTATPFVTLCASVAVSTNGTTATCAVPLLYQGVHSIVATFNASGSGGASANFSGSSSSVFPQTVNAAATSLSVVTSSASVAVNASVIFTATVTKPTDPSYTGTTLPGGTIAFSDGATLSTAIPISGCGAVAVAINGTAPCQTTFTTATTHTINAVYTPSTTPTTNFLTSSASVPQVVGQASTSLTVTSSLPSSTVNQAPVFTALLAFPSGNGTPSGSVTFTDISTGSILCTDTLPTGSSPFSLTCNYAFLVAGTRTIQVAYAGDTNFGPSSGSTSQAVGPTTTTLTVASAPSSSTVNQTVTLTLILNPAVTGAAQPKGTVTVTDTLTNTMLCSMAVAPNGSLPGCTTSFLVPGTHTITASFAPSDGNFVMSTAPTINEIVQSNGTTLVVTSSSGATTPTSSVDQSVTFSIVLTPTVQGTDQPKGMVTVRDTLTNSVLCSVTVAANGSVPSCTNTFLVVGTHPITANFAPSDTNFVASSAATVNQIVQPTVTTLALTSSSGATAPTSVALQQVTFTATLTPAFTGSTLPTGTVAFTLAGDTVDSCPTVALATSAQPYTATCSITFANTISGQVTVTAAYTPAVSAGVTNFQASTASVPQTVQNFTPGVSLVSLASAVPSVTITQGFSNLTDLFFPSTITLTSKPLASFTDSVTVTSCVATSGTGVALSGSFCTVAAVANNGTGTIATLTLAPTTSTPSGAYTVTVIVADSKAPALVYPVTFVANVVAQTVSSSLSAGAATGAFNATFGVPAASSSDTFNYACGKILYNGQATTAISCTTNPTSGPLSAAPFIITAGAATHAMALPVRKPAQRIFAAALLGIPIFALAGCFGRRGSRKSFLRFLAAITVLAGASQAMIGCGGGFTTTSATGSATGPAVGTYYVLVTATDTRTGITYDGVITVAIVSATGS